MDWSSLPPALIHHIAGGLLGTADLDCYMALRAVCHNWRAATDDPTNTMDRRFRRHNWVMLDYPTHDEDTRVLVNTETGRFHVRNIPMLRNYYIVSVTGDGLLVLAEKEAPHAACVLNPFTGYMVRFAARMRPHVMAAATGSRAIFISGGSRCVSINTAEFLSVEANCIYFTPHLGWPCTEIYHLEHGAQGQRSLSVMEHEDNFFDRILSGEQLLEDLPSFICNPLNMQPWTIIFLLSAYTVNRQSLEVSKELEYEDKLLEQLRSGKLSLEDLLRTSQEDTDFDD